MKIFNKITHNFMFSEKQFRKTVNVRNHQAHFSQNAGDTEAFFPSLCRNVPQAMVSCLFSLFTITSQTNQQWQSLLAAFQIKHKALSLQRHRFSVSTLKLYCFHFTPFKVYMSSLLMCSLVCITVHTSFFYVSNIFLAAVFSSPSPPPAFLSLF